MAHIEKLGHKSASLEPRHDAPAAIPQMPERRASASNVRPITSAPARVRSCDLPDAILRSAEDAIIGLALDGTIVSWNPGAERLFGFAPHEAISQPFSLILASEASTELLHLLAELPAGKRFSPRELECTRK